MSATRTPFPENVPGDFYVENGCCISCNMPFEEAPTLFSSAADGHCFVSKQPTNASEVFQMINALAVQDVGCVRFKGLNRVIQIKLVAAGEGDQCDHLGADLQLLKQEIEADRGGIA
jgi:hypothetical protein